MTTATAFFGLLGCGLLCLAPAAAALRLQRFPARVRTAAALAAAVAVFFPIGDLSIAGYVRGVTGDLSAPTLALAANAVCARLTGRTLIERRELTALFCLVAAAALFLYPFALGWTPFDPYALGYGSIAFVAALLLVTLAAWGMGLKLVVLVVLAGALACLGGLYESRNLWDYLIDPLAAAYALAVLLRAGGGKLWSDRRQRAPVV
ncbi:MAG TPA: hypothetical protein VFK92_02005 [Burkholderiales bacterium]|nr:hypothetical protein [Burkholderiales bacterium]